MSKKLYTVECTFQAFVLADDEKEAEGMWRDIISDEPPEIDVFLAGKSGILDGWDDDCLVHHAGREDITLREAREIARSPEAGNGTPTETP